MYFRYLSTLISVAGSLFLLMALLIGYSRSKTKSTHWGAIFSTAFLLAQLFFWVLSYMGMRLTEGSFWARIQTGLYHLMWVLSPLCLLGVGICLMVFFSQYRRPEVKSGEK
jgi:hypothetical protein